jgi:hypothetical protein
MCEEDRRFRVNRLIANHFESNPQHMVEIGCRINRCAGDQGLTRHGPANDPFDRDPQFV